MTNPSEIEHNYWFPLPDLEGQVINVITWRDIDREMPAGFPPYLVAVINKEEEIMFNRLSIEKKVKYLNYRGGFGHLIPSDELLEKILKETFYELKEFKDNIKEIPWENLGDALSKFIIKLIPVQSTLSDEKSNKLNNALGLSSPVITSLILDKGACYQRSSLAAVLVGDLYKATIVGFSGFSKMVWKEICEKMPPYKIGSALFGQIPMIYVGGLIDKNKVTKYASNRFWMPFKKGDKIELNPDKVPINNHYWVEIEDSGKIQKIETLIVPEGDCTYKFLDYCFEKMKNPVATCKVVNNKVVDYSPK